MRIKKTHAFIRAAAAVLAASTALTAGAAIAQQKAHLGTWGVDLTSRDLSVKPGDDFQKYASGA